MQLSVLTKWLGYLEHATTKWLGIPDVNIGKGGYTIFAQLILATQHINLMGLPWCATFVHAVIARPDLLGRAHAGCRVLQRRMKRRGWWRNRNYIPQPWDIVFCSNKRTKRVDHCGIVESCDGLYVISIDGNTTDPTGCLPPGRGGAVARRTRAIDDKVIVGYGTIGHIINADSIDKASA